MLDAEDTEMRDKVSARGELEQQKSPHGVIFVSTEVSTGCCGGQGSGPALGSVRVRGQLGGVS